MGIHQLKIKSLIHIKLFFLKILTFLCKLLLFGIFSKYLLHLVINLSLLLILYLQIKIPMVINLAINFRFDYFKDMII